MRSLELLAHESARIAGIDAGSRSFLTSDPENGVVYAAFEDNSSCIRIAVNGIAPDDPSAFVELARIPVEKQDNSNVSSIVGFTFLSDQQVACLAARNGDIMLISKERFDSGDEAVEIVGSVDTGICAMAWSPDQDLVVLVTGAKNVLEMTQDFDTITEFALQVEEEGEGVQHSVGWGKKETQFHGSVGKQAALNKIDSSKFTVSEDDDHNARIAWRGDGSYFACSDIDPRKSARVVRIYNREGILQNTSEPVDRLEHVLDWRPSGNLIVSSQRLPHRHDIVFIERNGLRHGEFTLREKTNHKLLELLWNADSTVLAVWLEAENPVTGKPQKSVQLWTSNNYYWYMKQHIVCADGSDVLGFHWDVETPLCAHIMTSSGHYHRYAFAWDVLASTSIAENNAGYVAVIDGASVLLTPFSYQNVPPPMCALTITANSNVQQVAFGPESSGTQLAVVTNEAIQLFEVPANARGEPKQIGTFALPKSSEESTSHAAIRHLCWFAENKAAYVQYDEQEEADMLFLVKFSEAAEGKLDVLSTTPLGKRVGRLYYNMSFNDLIVETMDGSVRKVNATDDSNIELSELVKFPSFCPWIATTRLDQKSDNPEDKLAVIGLTERGKLYAGDRLLSGECTSFFLRNDWLALSTTSHTARFLPLDVKFDDFKLSDNAPDSHDESYRRVERGAKIVLATQAKPSLVLQMPRGNLETVNPRAFVLAQIREDLKNLNYRSAFIICRKNRIDLNVLCDENPESFYENIPRFIEQIPEVDHLNLFLSNLKNIDTTKTLYRHGGSDKQENKESASVEDKVNKICKAFRDVLMEKGRDRYIQSILSTYVKSSPPELESALQLLADIKVQNANEAEEALKYTIFLCDADSLYDVALGMYNFSLVLMVAQQAQKDPREYLPFLQELQKLEKFYQRFRIDDHLKRYASALKNLSKAGDEHFDELVNYTRKHVLYLVALEEYANHPQQKKIILDVYGDYLVDNNAHGEAGIVYLLCDQTSKALNAYRLGGAWREVFSLAKQLQYSAEDIQGLAYDVLGNLKEKSRYQEAAVVAVDYGKDIEEAVDCLLKGSHWQEAARVSRTHERSDLIETHVNPGLYEGYTQAEEELDNMTSQFNKQKNRLKELRETKLDPDANLPHDETLDNIDMFSDTTSMYSQFTRYTQATSRVSTVSSVSSKSSRKTSKLRRREQRKREKGKKGTIYEEEYLVTSLRKLCERASNMQNDMHDLLRALIPFGYMEEARILQTKFAQFLVDIKAAMDGIFIPLQLAPGRYASQEELDATKQPVDVEKPKVADVDWSLQLLG
ncbi:IKI3 family-domain-containing protein [Zychaea mexicana]|uniref:IKI3 family-domain-containing protein n=1 Tax=Zychaea mexicana TaxID=64656 RepID=UPI0022FE757B|nr:IKI3 family-domain-containing protein [Zychaea mexicana]KAI9485105.1 IKI3 family-domain-containing protein [Zychaea mexicana]